MKKLLLLLLGLSLASVASAQTVTVTEEPTPSAASRIGEWQISSSQSLPLGAPLADNIRLAYYDPQGQILTLEAPSLPNPNVPDLFAIGFGQRFTLPAATGFLDSLRVQFTSINQVSAGGQVNILVLRDSLYENGAEQDFHLPRIDQSGVIGAASVPAAAVAGLQNFTLTVNFNHMEVPKEFFVYIAPAIAGGTNSSSFRIPAEATPTVTRSTENSRSVIHLVQGSNQGISILDSFYSVNQQPINVNLAIEAFVDVEAGSVPRNNIEPALMYPNPIVASSLLKIQHPNAISGIRIVNILGDEVQSWGGQSNSVELSTAQFAKGVYQVIVTTESGVTTEKLVVE